MNLRDRRLFETERSRSLALSGRLRHRRRGDGDGDRQGDECSWACHLASISRTFVRETNNYLRQHDHREPTTAIRRASSGLFFRTSASAEATTTTMMAWPISTPRLKEKSETPRARLGSPVSRSTLAKPNP